MRALLVIVALLVAACAGTPPPSVGRIAASDEPKPAPMPFGGSMFGPWSPDEERTREPVLAGDDAVSGMDHPRFISWLWPVVRAHGWDLKYGRNLPLPDTMTVPDPAWTNQLAAIRWLADLCRTYKLDLSAAGNRLSIRAMPKNELRVEALPDGRIKMSCVECDLLAVISEVARVAKVETLIKEPSAQAWRHQISLSERTLTVGEAMQRLADIGELALSVFNDGDGEDWYGFAPRAKD